MFRTFLLVILFLFLLEGDLFSQRNWTSKKKEDGIEVFVKSQERRVIKAYKAVTTTSASVDDCVEFLLDLENHINWSYTVVTAEMQETGENNLTCYMIMDAPWPVEDRDIVIQVSKKNLNKDKIQVSLTAIEGVVDEQEGMVRIKQSVTTWTFTKNGNHTDIVYQGITDPGGKVPDWIINAGLVDGPYETLKNFISEVEK